MAKKNSGVRGRVWSILRLALLWARKGGVFRRLLMEIRLAPKLIKDLGGHAERIHYYQERQLSFDKTPIFDLKIHRPHSTRFHIPCITAPQVDSDNDFNDDYECDVARRSFLKGCQEDKLQEERGGEIIPYKEEQGIDERAEEFISNFYLQMKMQRQISCLQDNDETPRSCTK